VESSTLAATVEAKSDIPSCQIWEETLKVGFAALGVYK